MDLVSMIMLTTAVVVCGVIAGALVQKVTYFLYPVDIFTAILLSVVLTEWFCASTPDLEWLCPVDVYWFVPLTLGYFVGYIVSGRTRYLMIRSFSGDKSTTGEYWVVYTKKGKSYMQEQSNRELLKRLLFGIEHEIQSNADLKPDWDDATTYPLFPTFRRRFVMVESWETFEIPPKKRSKFVRKLGTTVEVEPRWYLKRYVTAVCVARGSMASRVDLIRDMNALERMQGDLIEANNKIFKLQQSLSIKMADTVAEFLADVYTKAPGASLSVSARRWADKQREKEKEREKDVEKE